MLPMPWYVSLQVGFFVYEYAGQTQEPGQLVTTTVRDYDLSETSKLVRLICVTPGVVAEL